MFPFVLFLIFEILRLSLLNHELFFSLPLFRNVTVLLSLPFVFLFFRLPTVILERSCVLPPLFLWLRSIFFLSNQFLIDGLLSFLPHVSFAFLTSNECFRLRFQPIKSQKRRRSSVVEIQQRRIKG